MRVHLTTLTDAPPRGRAGATILAGVARSRGAGTRLWRGRGGHLARGDIRHRRMVVRGPIDWVNTGRMATKTPAPCFSHYTFHQENARPAKSGNGPRFGGKPWERRFASAGGIQVRHAHTKTPAPSTVNCYGSDIRLTVYALAS